MATKKKSTAKKTTTKAQGNPYIELVSSNGGRPRKVLTEKGLELVEKLSQFMATDEEIADALSDKNEKITVDTLTNENNIDTFSEYKKKGQSKGKTSLRSWQFATAKKGNATMQIFLGKNYLGQTDKQDIDIDGTAAVTFIEDIKE